MHPAFFHWWKHARQHHRHGHEHHGPHACAPGFGPPPPPPDGEPHGPPPPFARFMEDGGPFGGGPFGVRRPLRFLAHKLDLTEDQVEELARIIDELKTERAQAEVDHRRTVTAFADALETATFGQDRAKEGGELRVKSAERLREAVEKALGRIHALLTDDQRKRFAYLVRTGVVSL